MRIADLHIHSCHSKHSSEWFLKKLGTSESYTGIKELYASAKKRGMRLVTVTDHNTIEGALRLREHSPADTFISVESTVYFPENGCKIHLLVFDLTPGQFARVDALRGDVYALREYLLRERLAHSVAHAPFAVNGKLTREVLEKLILLFDVFEEINGSRCLYPRWSQTLRELTPAHIDALRKKHGIVPASPDPWVKGFTGGSDDHAGLFIGRTFTEASRTDKDGFIRDILEKKSSAGGRYNNYKSWTFSIYRIASQYPKSKGVRPNRVLEAFNKALFCEGRPDFRSRALIRGAGRLCRKNRIFHRFISDCSRKLCSPSGLSLEEKIDIAYSGIADLLDDFFLMVMDSAGKNIKEGDMLRLLKNLSALLPAAFLSAPFFSALRHLNRDYPLIEEFARSLGIAAGPAGREIICFTDHPQGLEELKHSVEGLFGPGARVRIAACAEEPGNADILRLPCIRAFTPEFCQSLTLRVPSILRSVELVSSENPSGIVVHTPGPAGLTGLLLAKLLGVQCTAVFHTDLTEKANRIFDDERVCGMVESYLRWFYSQMDEVVFPSIRSLETLESRHYEIRQARFSESALTPAR